MTNSTSTTTNLTTSNACVDRFVASIEAGRPLDGDALHPDVVLDATLPNWRMHRLVSVPSSSSSPASTPALAGTSSCAGCRSLMANWSSSL